METGSFIQQVHYNYELLEDFRDLFEDKGPNSYGISPGLARTFYYDDQYSVKASPYDGGHT